MPLLPAGRAGRSTVVLLRPSRCASQAVQAVLLQNLLIKPWTIVPCCAAAVGQAARDEQQSLAETSNSRCKRALRWSTTLLMGIVLSICRLATKQGLPDVALESLPATAALKRGLQ